MSDVEKYNHHYIFGIKQSPPTREGMGDIMSSFCNPATVSEVGNGLLLSTTADMPTW